MPAARKDVDTALDDADAGFPTWDSMVAEARSQVAEITPYRIPFGDKTIEIPVPDGIRYMEIVEAQRRGNARDALLALIENDMDRAYVIAKMRGVEWPIIDVITAKALRHFYGLPIEVEEKAGNSPGS